MSPIFSWYLEVDGFDIHESREDIRKALPMRRTLCDLKVGEEAVRGRVELLGDQR